MILSLSSHLCNDILIQWLRFKDLGTLDVSYTCWQCRSEFLSLLSELRNVTLFHEKINVLKWICIRSIKVSTLRLNSSLIAASEQLQCIDTSQILTVSFSGATLTDALGLNEFLASCHALRYIEILDKTLIG